MKKLSALLILGLVVFPLQKTRAQIPISEIIKAAVKKVIIAVDLRIQRLQNKTIWLQNAQKTVENQLQKLKLEEISEWVERQRSLYAGYYAELREVKSALINVGGVKDIIQTQLQIIDEYNEAGARFRKDPQLTLDEVSYMAKVLSGILEQSAKSLDALYLIITSDQSEMSDGKRLNQMKAVGKNMDAHLVSLRQLNERAMRISFQRAKDLSEINHVKALYGIQ